MHRVGVGGQSGGRGCAQGGTHSSRRLWLSSWEGGIRQQLNVMTRLPRWSSPGGRHRCGSLMTQAVSAHPGPPHRGQRGAGGP